MGEVAQYVGVEQHVLRHWEEVFSIKPKRSKGGWRVYSRRQVRLLCTIRWLLHDELYTTEGAKQWLSRRRIGCC